MDKRVQNGDRRARKTRQALYKGLVRLMQQKSVQDITVTELAAECDINRGTFYLHYSSVQQLLKSLEEEVLEGLNAVLEKFETTSFLPKNNALTEIFQFLGENAALCSVMLSRRGDAGFVRQVTQVVRTRCLPQWLRLAGQSSAGEVEYFLTFVLAGSIGLIEQWLADEVRESPAEMARRVENYIGQGAAALRIALADLGVEGQECKGGAVKSGACL